MTDAPTGGVHPVHIGRDEEWGARTPTPALPPAPPPPPPPPAPPLPPAGPLHDALGLLGAAVSRLTEAGTPRQVAAAGEVLDQARHAVDRLLAGGTP